MAEKNRQWILKRRPQGRIAAIENTEIAPS
jgi:hypothetical protein